MARHWLLLACAHSRGKCCTSIRARVAVHCSSKGKAGQPCTTCDSFTENDCAPGVSPSASHPRSVRQSTWYEVRSQDAQACAWMPMPGAAMPEAPCLPWIDYRIPRINIIWFSNRFMVSTDATGSLYSCALLRPPLAFQCLGALLMCTLPLLSSAAHLSVRSCSTGSQMETCLCEMPYSFAC